jgi:hypothetical protein
MIEKHRKIIESLDINEENFSFFSKYLCNHTQLLIENHH